MRILLVLALLFVVRIRAGPAALEAVVSMVGDVLAKKFREHLQDLLKRPCNCQLVMNLPEKFPWYHKKAKKHHRKRSHLKRRKHKDADERRDSQQKDGNPSKQPSPLTSEQMQQLLQLPPEQQVQALQQIKQMQAQKRPSPSQNVDEG